MDITHDALPKQLPGPHVVISMKLSVSTCGLVSAAGLPSNCSTLYWSGADSDVAFTGFHTTHALVAACCPAVEVSEGIQGRCEQLLCFELVCHSDL